MPKLIELVFFRRRNVVIDPHESQILTQAQANIAHVYGFQALASYGTFLVGDFADEELGARRKEHSVARLFFLIALESEVIVYV